MKFQQNPTENQDKNTQDSNAYIALQDAANELNMPLIEFKKLIRGYGFNIQETTALTMDELARIKEAENQTMKNQTAIKPVEPQEIHQEKPLKQPANIELITDIDWKIQAYNEGIKQAQMFFAIQQATFNNHYQQLKKGENLPQIDPDEIAKEIAAIEEKLKAKK